MFLETNVTTEHLFPKTVANSVDFVQSISVEPFVGIQEVPTTCNTWSQCKHVQINS